jgi:hypothetical protein
MGIMARALRLEVAGGWYHVVNRGIERRKYSPAGRITGDSWPRDLGYENREWPSIVKAVEQVWKEPY